jgi:hypothetical protein
VAGGSELAEGRAEGGGERAASGEREAVCGRFLNADCAQRKERVRNKIVGNSCARRVRGWRTSWRSHHGHAFLHDLHDCDDFDGGLPPIAWPGHDRGAAAWPGSGRGAALGGSMMVGLDLGSTGLDLGLGGFLCLKIDFWCTLT